MMTYLLSRSDKNIQGHIKLEGSKSISNRVLIIQALCGDEFIIENLARAKDTQTLRNLLISDNTKLDVGPAGTSFRFLTAYLSLKNREYVLTGSRRMKERPIGKLVDALRYLGAEINYLEKEGFPPLKIKGNSNLGKEKNEIHIPADVSSQFISALLLIAPNLKKGLTINLIGKIASRPYIEMTLQLMSYFGAKWSWVENQIAVKGEPYCGQEFAVESDWSAASYFYSIAALSDSTHILIDGLRENSLQGDSAILEIAAEFGVKSAFKDGQLNIRKEPVMGNKVPGLFNYDFDKTPDLAQTVVTFCGALGSKGLFTGLDSLLIKETERLQALQQELRKVGLVFIKRDDEIKNSYQLSGVFELSGRPVFETYDDHRMAMCLAPLALFGEISIKDPAVVGKSFPSFWEKLKKLGFKITSQTPEN